MDDALYEHIKVVDEGIEEGCPDGAWWARLAEGIQEYNPELDVEDTISDYLERNYGENPPTGELWIKVLAKLLNELHIHKDRGVRIIGNELLAEVHNHDLTSPLPDDLDVKLRAYVVLASERG